jgi:hypothetical protein
MAINFAAGIQPGDVMAKGDGNDACDDLRVALLV